MATAMNFKPPSTATGFYRKDMELGYGVDCLTGKTKQSALEPTTSELESTTPTEQFSAIVKKIFTLGLDVADILHPSLSQFSESFIFPDTLSTPQETSAERDDDLSHKSIVFLHLLWERRVPSKRRASSKLDAVASEDLSKGPNYFWDKYGHYFVSEISLVTRFEAVWTCSANKYSQILAFRKQLPQQISFESLESRSFTDTVLQDAAQKNDISLDVRYHVVGEVDQSIFDADAITAFWQFCGAATPVPYRVELTPYSQVDTSVPPYASATEVSLRKIARAYQLVHSASHINSALIAPKSIRSNYETDIQKLWSKMEAARSKYMQDAQGFVVVATDLKKLHDTLHSYQERQTFVMEARSLTYEDFKCPFVVDDEDDSGARVRGCDTYIIGPSEFDDPIKCKEYGVESVVVNDSETRTDSGTRRLEFPGKTHPSGYVVGLILEGRGDYDGSASFRIDRDLALGMDSVRIDVTGEKTYWKLHVFFIPKQAVFPEL